MFKTRQNFFYKLMLNFYLKQTESYIFEALNSLFRRNSVGLSSTVLALSLCCLACQTKGSSQPCRWLWWFRNFSWFGNVQVRLHPAGSSKKFQSPTKIFFLGILADFYESWHFESIDTIFEKIKSQKWLPHKPQNDLYKSYSAHQNEYIFPMIFVLRFILGLTTFTFPPLLCTPCPCLLPAKCRRVQLCGIWKVCSSSRQALVCIWCSHPEWLPFSC